MSSSDEEIPEVIELPIDGCLDLHSFAPKDCKSLIPDYLSLCAERGIFAVRIIHGKGHGILQRSVHAILARLPGVAHFQLADASGGGWGATLVTLQGSAETVEPGRSLMTIDSGDKTADFSLSGSDGEG